MRSVKPWLLLIVLATGLGAVGQLVLMPPSRADDQGNESKQPDREQNGQSLMREVVRNEADVQQSDHSLWSHVEIRTQNGRTQKTEFVDTPGGQIHRLQAINGEPLDPTSAAKESARIRHLASNPDEIRQKAQAQVDDEKQERHFLTMLPDALFYRVASRKGNLVELVFRPNPAFKPQEREGEVFHHMVGRVWVDATQKHIVQMEGQLVSNVKFGGGLLGHLDKGGTFLVEQKDLGGGHWAMTRLDINMSGKALFFKTIAVHQNQSDSDYKMLPPNTTLDQAIALLTRN